MPRDEVFDPITLLPEWVKKEKELAHMLPYVSLVDDVTVRTRGNELFQCIRLEGVNSYTKDDEHLDKIRGEYLKLCVWRSGHAVKTGHLLNRSG